MPDSSSDVCSCSKTQTRIMSISVTLRMADSATAQTFHTPPAEQLLPLLEMYSAHIGVNVHALFFR